MKLTRLLPIKFMMRLFPKILIVLLFFVSGWLFVFYLTGKQVKVEYKEDFILKNKNGTADNDLLHIQGKHERLDIPKAKVDKKLYSSHDIKTKKKKFDTFSCNKVHIFYYPWYGNPDTDKKYMHWNHEYIPHWSKRERNKKKTGRHVPPDDLASDFYPALGPYSSKDPSILSEHIAQIRSSGAGVIVISYYPVGQGDREGKDWSDIYPILFDAAQRAGLKVTFHIEPYENRTPGTTKDDIKWIIETFGEHPALYKATRKTEPNGPKLPFLYVYDSYLNLPELWGEILSHGTDNSIRGTPFDAILIGLLVEAKHREYITIGKFDGFYTYFATKEFTYGSNWDNWEKLSQFASDTNTYFIPSVGPGYIDVSIRAWNGENTRSRQNGAYYNNAWQKAIKSNPSFVSITSFNEWHEGTQIEKAIPKKTLNRIYLDYSPNDPNFYLTLSTSNAKKFPKCIK